MKKVHCLRLSFASSLMGLSVGCHVGFKPLNASTRYSAINDILNASKCCHRSGSKSTISCAYLALFESCSWSCAMLQSQASAATPRGRRRTLLYRKETARYHCKGRFLPRHVRATCPRRASPAVIIVNLAIPRLLGATAQL